MNCISVNYFLLPHGNKRSMQNSSDHNHHPNYYIHDPKLKVVVLYLPLSRGRKAFHIRIDQ